MIREGQAQEGIRAGEDCISRQNSNNMYQHAIPLTQLKKHVKPQEEKKVSSKKNIYPEKYLLTDA